MLAWDYIYQKKHLKLIFVVAFKRYSHSGYCICLPSRISWVRVPHTALIESANLFLIKVNEQRLIGTPNGLARRLVVFTLYLWPCLLMVSGSEIFTLQTSGSIPTRVTSYSLRRSRLNIKTMPR